jgi:ABC-type phosphate transport system substrate-binding protein
MKRITIAALALTLLVAAATGRAGEPLSVIVNAGNPVSGLPRVTVANIFLKKAGRWASGEAVLPVDQAPDAPVRATFSRVVHGKPTSAVAAYWQQQIFAGRGVPPVEKAGDEAVIEFVKSHPGAIGYISGGATSGVKVISLQ